jgi:hypothetical protein
LFIFGHSLAENDQHILRQIGRGRCGKLFVSLYGDPGTEANRAIVARAQLIADTRHEKYPLEIEFFNAESAEVWS